MNTYIRILKNFLLSSAFMLLAAAGYCQSFEIRTVNRGMGVIAVEMRVTGGTLTTSDFITDMVFGIKWSSAYSVDLLPAFSSSYNIRRSGARALRGGFHYQAFFADFVPFNVPANWAAGSWIEILSISNDRSGTGTGTFAIAEHGFDPSTNPNIGISLTDYTPAVVSSATDVLLPAKLAAFEAVPYNRVIKVQWSTVNEQNSKGFEVQRAEGVNNVFNTIGWVDSKVKAGNNNQYEFLDKEVTAKVKYFYRIKQVDNDGGYTYSPLKTAVLDGMNAHPARILPNPVDRTLQLILNNAAREEVVLQIIDAKGSVVQTRKEYIDPGKKVEMNTSDLTSGQYFLIIKNQDGSVLTKAFQKR